MGQDNLVYRFYHGLWAGLEWIFPPTCGGCDHFGSRWCADCQSRLKFPPDPVCAVCGTPQASIGVCEECASLPPHFVSLRSWSIFDDPVRKALHRLKYLRDVGLRDTLAGLIADTLREFDWPKEIVVPVPLSKRRKKERGYNQVCMVALPLSLMCGWGYRPQALLRARETRSQVGLSRDERKQNVRNAFAAEKSMVEGRNILIIDDVTRAGATLSACAKALMKAGAGKIYGFMVTRALARHGLKIV